MSSASFRISYNNFRTHKDILSKQTFDQKYIYINNSFLPHNTMAEDQGENWFPLESNPDVINPYVSSLGFDVTQYSWVDLLSVEEWA